MGPPKLSIILATSVPRQRRVCPRCDLQKRLQDGPELGSKCDGISWTLSLYELNRYDHPTFCLHDAGSVKNDCS